MNPRIRSALLASAFCAVVCVTPDAFAQSVNTPKDSSQRVHSDQENPDIVVTAQRREERLIDVPISITAYNGDDLRLRNVTDLAGLAAFTPGLEVTPSQSGGAGLTIRGITTGVGGVGVDPSVGVYVDDVYVPRDWVAMQSYLDIERVEVLRGPQGTLYGRNTTGGAYNIHHKLPTNDFEFGGAAQFASFNRQRYEAYLSGPIVEDKVLFRVAGARETADEYGHNLYTGKRLKATDSWQGIATLELRPTENLTLTVRGDAMKDDGRVGAVYHLVRRGTVNADAELPSSPYDYMSDFPSNGNYLRNRGSRPSTWCKFGCGQRAAFSGGPGCNL